MVNRQSTEHLAIGAILIAASLWGIVWYPLRLLEVQGMHGLWSSLLVYGIPASLGVIFWHRRWRELLAAPRWLVLVCIGNGWCNVAFIIAILDGEVMRVLLLFYLSPLWATLLAWLLIGEQPHRLGFITLGIAMLGAVIMLWDPTLSAPWPQSAADWLAISAGFAFAFANVGVRHLQVVSLPVKILASWVGVAILALVWLLVIQLPIPQSTATVWTATSLLGPLIVIVMSFTVFYGVTHLPVHRSAVLLLFELIVGAVSSQLLTDEVMEITEWLGGALIITAAYLSSRHTPDQDEPDQGQATSRDNLG